MTNAISVRVNEESREVRSSPDTPLIYVLRNEFGLNGPQFGCGLEQCGACMVLVGRKATLSCRMPVGDVGSASITTLEGLSMDGTLHPVQQAFVVEQAAQCGYCTNGMIIRAVALLAETPHPTDEQARAALDGNLCRCGAHLRILRAIRRAEQLLAQLT
jgi:nicotinate dehydrogenase subunit A